MEEIDLKEIFEMFWSKKIIIIVILFVSIVIGVIYHKTMVIPEYKSTATLVLVKNSDNNNNQTITQSEVTLNQKLVATYTELIKSNNVLRKVIENLGISMEESTLRSNIKVGLVTNTQLIEISVANTDPELAQQFTNEIVKVFIEKVEEVYKINNINVVDQAKLPTAPYNINLIKTIAIFAMIGIIIAGAYVFIAGVMDSTIKSAEKVEKDLGLTVLAQIPQYDYEAKKKGKE